MGTLKNHLLLLTLFLLLNTSLFAQSIEILYEERAPYVIKKNRSIEGLVASTLIKALEKTDIKYTLKEKPSKRHLSEIRANKAPLCAVGWFKNSEREKFAKYTKKLYQDKPMGIITRKNHPFIKNGLSIEALLKKDKIVMLGKSAYSYGRFVDEKIEEYAIKRRDVSSYNVKMLTLVAKKRADFMFISFEEAQHLLASHPQKEELHYIRLKNMPQGNRRYLICSFSVLDSVISKLNDQIK